MSNNVIVSTRVRLARNVTDMPFSCRMADGALDTLVGVNREILDSMYGSCQEYYMADMPDTLRYGLVERHYISPRHANKIEDTALVANLDERIAIMINEEDHVRAQIFEPGYNLYEAFNRATCYDRILGERLSIATDSRYGYLTACPTNLGLAMRVGVMAFLPALAMTERLKDLFSIYRVHSVEVRGIYGEGSNSDSYLYQISKRVGLGISAVELVDETKSAINYMISEELEARERLMQDNFIYLQDKVMRAYGTLANAKLISQNEFNDCISMVRLGASLSIIKCDQLWAIDQLRTDGQRNVLSLNAGVQLSSGVEEESARADLARSGLSMIK